MWADLCARRGSALHCAKGDGTLSAAPASETEALLRPGVAAEVERRYARLRFYAVEIVQCIALAATNFPFGIRWICRQLQHMSDGRTASQQYRYAGKARGASADAADTRQIVGAFFFLRFVNPCLVAPGINDIWRAEDAAAGDGARACGGVAAVTAALAATTAVDAARDLASSIAAEDEESAAQPGAAVVSGDAAASAAAADGGASRAPDSRTSASGGDMGGVDAHATVEGGAMAAARAAARESSAEAGAADSPTAGGGHQVC